MCNDSLRHLSTLLAGSLLVGLILLVQPGHAQPQQLNFDHYTIDDGLANGSALSILQDRQGFMWFGTGVGLTNGYVSKFDGYTFTNYAQITGDTTSFGGGYAWALLEDRHGVLWIGSGNGLNRFDPTTETFTRYDLVTSDTTSLPGGVRVLYEDQEGVLWIGTGGSGLLRFNPRTESFIGYQQDPQNPTRLLGTIVSSIVEDQTGTLWIGTWDGGLTRYDRQKNTVVHYTHDPLNPHSLPFPTVTSLVIDHTGTLWVGSLGLSRYDPATDAFTTFYPDPDHLTTDLADPLFFNNAIGSLYQDRAGNLWAGTRSGLLHFDPETEAFTAFKRDPDHPGSLNDDRVASIFEDRFGALWVGTQFMGLNRADRSTSLIPHHLPAPNDAQSPRNYIQALLESRDGSLWVGNLDGVLERTDSLNNTIRRYQHDPSNPASLSPGNAQAMLEDATGVIWIGTGLQYDSHMPGGLNRYDPKTDTFTRNLFDPELPALQILTLTEPPSAPGILWIGTWNGLYRYDTRTTAVTHYTHDPTNPYSLSDPVVFSIYEDLGGTLWVGTEQGLNRLNRPYEPLRGDTETEVFTRFLHSNLDDEVVAIHEDQQAPGILWIASRGGSGLMRFDTKTEQFSFFTEANSGLANNAVYGILDDADGNLWLSTNNGLSRFTPKTGQFKNYGVSQGVQSREFNTGSYHKGHSGTLYFGGINGYNAFKPRDLRGNPYPPELVITDLKLFNISVEPAPDGILQEPISTTEALTLAYEENDLSFDYVGLHFSNTKKIQYAYWLENYEDDWRYVGTQRTATYTNLDPGTYTFRVKAANSDGVWNETGASVEITIHPPWWRTMWAYLLYGLLFIGGVFVVDRFQRKRLIRKERERAHEVLAKAHTELEVTHKHLKTTQAQLVQQEKMASLGQLTAGIAHEIKNPLNFVNNFAEVNEELAQELDEALDADEDKTALKEIIADLMQNAQVIAQHGKRADGIVHAMMQHASGGTGQREPTDINALVSEHIDLAYHGKRAQVTGFSAAIERDLDDDTGEVEIVPQEIGRVLLNLLSNAFDAVHEHAVSVNGQYEPTVTVTTRQVDGQVEIRVSDNGPGIPAEIKDRIFEPFFTTKPTGTGTGLGLSLSYDIVTQGHGGRLTVESTEGEGATFVITLPRNSPNTG